MPNKNSYIMIVAISAIALFAPTSASASWFISEPGVLSYINSSILGDEAQSSGVFSPIEPSGKDFAKSTQSSESSEGSSSTYTLKSQGQSRERAKQQMENNLEQVKKNMEKSVQTQKKLLESKKQTANFELKSENSTPGAEVNKPPMLVVREHIVNSDGTIASEKDKSVEGEDQITINRADGNPVQVSAKSENKLEIMRDKFKANTEMPVSVNENNELILTKKDGTTKVLTILPDEAVGRLREKGINIATESSDVATSSPELSEEGGQAVYKFSTDQEKKVFGFFRVNLKRQVSVSAETGEVVSTSESPLTKLLNFLSF